MKPVDQTRFGHPGGNCYQAALASVLELPLEDVPDFCNNNLDGDWANDLNVWLYDYGRFSFQIDPALGDPEALEWLTDNCICLATVQSESTEFWIDKDGERQRALHTVVWYKGKVVHDPHPSRAHEQSVPVHIEIFCLLDPAVVFTADRMKKERPPNSSLELPERDREAFR